MRNGAAGKRNTVSEREGRCQTRECYGRQRYVAGSVRGNKCGKNGVIVREAHKRARAGENGYVRTRKEERAYMHQRRGMVGVYAR